MQTSSHHLALSSDFTFSPACPLPYTLEPAFPKGLGKGGKWWLGGQASNVELKWLTLLHKFGSICFEKKKIKAQMSVLKSRHSGWIVWTSQDGHGSTGAQVYIWEKNPPCSGYFKRAPYRAQDKVSSEQTSCLTLRETLFIHKERISRTRQK